MAEQIQDIEWIGLTAGMRISGRSSIQGFKAWAERMGVRRLIRDGRPTRYHRRDVEVATANGQPAERIEGPGVEPVHAS